MTNDIKQFLHQHNQDSLIKRRAIGAANWMMLELNIPNGNHLGFLLGHPNAVSNQEAIQKWVHVESGGVMVDEQIYSHLLSKLKTKLMSLCEATY